MIGTVARMAAAGVMTKGDAAYKAACLADSASLFVRLSTGTPVDASATGATLTPYTGTATFTTDPTYGQVLNGGSIAWTTTAILNLPVYTLEAVCYSPLTSAYRGLIGSWATKGAMLVGHSPGYLAINDSAANVRINVGNAADANAWHHVVQTFDGTTLRGWIDGVNVVSAASATATNSSTSPSNALQIATYNNDLGSPRFIGQIHSVSAYPTALTGTRLAAHSAAII